MIVVTCTWSLQETKGCRYKVSLGAASHEREQNPKEKIIISSLFHLLMERWVKCLSFFFSLHHSNTASQLGPEPSQGAGSLFLKKEIKRSKRKDIMAPCSWFHVIQVCRPPIVLQHHPHLHPDPKLIRNILFTPFLSAETFTAGFHSTSLPQKIHHTFHQQGAG